VIGRTVDREKEYDCVSPVVQKPADKTSILSRIDSVMVLCGSVHSTPLARRVGRSLVDLPLQGGRTLASRHFEAIKSFSEKHSGRRLPLRMIYDADGETPRGVEGADPGSCVVEQDPSPIRGVAGLLADATKEIDDDQYIVVSNGALVFLEPFGELVASMAATEADVSFVASRDGAPVGIWLIRCGVLRSIKSVGYIDLKEQALESWNQTHKVRVVERPRAYSMPTRSLQEYLDALHALSIGSGYGASVDEDPYREEWESSFRILEQGAEVAEDAVLHDAVALSGSRVGKGAVVVRSVLCEGAVVAPGAMVADKVVTGTVRKERVR
jgi:hypothetical protein